MNDETRVSQSSHEGLEGAVTFLHQSRDTLEPMKEIQTHHDRVYRRFLPQVKKNNGAKEKGRSRGKGGSRENTVTGESNKVPLDPQGKKISSKTTGLWQSYFF